MSKVVWSGPQGGVPSFVGGSVTSICGFTAAEMLAAPRNTWMDRVHPDDRPRVKAGLRGLRGPASPFEVEFRWQRKDGEWRWFRARAVARAGTAPQILDGIVADITGEKLLEDEMRQLQKVDAVGQFTGGIAHDFNNLLAVILANDTMLLDDLAEGDPRRVEALGILDAAQRAAALTHQLLAFSRRHAYNPTAVDVTAIVAGTERMLRRVIGEDIELSVVLGDGMHGVRADAAQLGQVILNLALNARDAMAGGGKLSIAISAEGRHEFRGGQAAPADGPYVVIEVADTGCGMDAETRRRAFEPFFTTKDCGTGTGLGLSTCARIVQQIGGHISVNSEPGQGTVVSVFLPRDEGAREAMAPAEPARATRPACTETILLVEDDDAVRCLVRRGLETLGYHVLDAGSGQDALAIVGSSPSPIDLVLSDVVMPDLSGMDIVTRVQARSAGTKALFMSGHIDHALVRDGRLQAGSHFIQKPFMPLALARKIREVLDA